MSVFPPTRPSPARLLSFIVVLISTLLGSPAARAQGALTNGGIHNGSITTAGEADDWTVTVAAGDKVLLRASQTSGGTDFAPRVRVFDAGSSLVGVATGSNSSSTSSARWDHTVPVSGTLTVRIDSALPAGTGNYRIDLLRLPAAFTIPGGETGGPLDNEGRHDGAIALGDVDAWTFSAAAGDTVELRAAQLSGGSGFVPRVSVHDSAGNRVVEAAGGGSSDTSEARVTFRPASSDDFTLVIDSVTPEGTGNYRLYQLRLPASITTPSSDTGGALTNGDNHDGAITLGDQDAWTFDATAGDRIFLRAGQTSGGTTFAPRIHVHDAAGALVASAGGAENSTSSEARLAYTPAASGVFSVVVDSALVEGTGSYRLFYLKLPGIIITPSGDDGAPLVSGNDHDGATSLGDLDVWTFDANTADRVTLDLRQLSGDTSYSPRARVFDPAGELVGYTSDPAASSTSQSALTLILPATGTYSVVIDASLVGGSGNYRLNHLLEAGPFLPPIVVGTPLANGGNHEGTIVADTEDDWTFDAGAGDRVLLRVGQLTGGFGFSPRLQLIDPNGVLVASDFQSGNRSDSAAEVAVIAEIGGTYTVTIDSGVASGSGDYRLHFLRRPGSFTIPGGDQGGALTNGGNHEGTVTVADLDGWTFDADAGDRVLLRVGQLTGGFGFTPRLQLFSPDGVLVASDFQSGNRSDSA
ncbi:MAG TPA: hypothetical protein DCY13_04580, partial [Verrucomicrobiales bacterium]|nr:hypothetical protein [Verrucomicrobiales bacterium]